MRSRTFSAPWLVVTRRRGTGRRPSSGRARRSNWEARKRKWAISSKKSWRATKSKSPGARSRRSKRTPSRWEPRGTSWKHRPPMTRDAALALMHEYTASESLRRHMLAVEAAMRAYARKWGEDEEKYGIVG